MFSRLAKVNIFARNESVISFKNKSGKEWFLQWVHPANNNAMKTGKCRSVAAIVLLMIMAGSCGNTSSEKSERTRLSLAAPSMEAYYRGIPKIRFRCVAQKDAATLAREKACEEWNRNLHLRGGCPCCLDECVEDYGKCP